MIDKSEYFRIELLNWYQSNTRPLPWKSTKDPYVIWLSEIILQQTRVAQGTPYFLKFLRAYPTIDLMSAANTDEIMNHWEGLGYYSRARNMHATARYITDNLNGVFPRAYKDILKLKGVGPYTAAAISSFAYDEPYPVVDGNVIRLLSRYDGITDYVDDTVTKRYIQTLAESLIDKEGPATYNQAIMDFGSLVCSPKAPDCIKCPLSKHCEAYQFEIVTSIPKKYKKIKKRNRFFHFFIIEDDEQIILQKRMDKDIWLDLYQYPMIETKDIDTLGKNIIDELMKILDITTYKISMINDNICKQTLTHQNIKAKFYHISVNEALKSKSKPYYLVIKKNLENFAFPKIINAYPLSPIYS